MEEEAGVRRWLVDITRRRPSPAQFEATAALLPSHECPAITRFVKEDDRKRALVSRLLQYSLVHRILRIPFQQINIFRTLEGKPYLSAGTHSEMLTEFYRCWCLKEAFVKAIGAGFGFGLHRLKFHHEHWTNISIHIDGEVSKKWRFWLFKLNELHLASIAKGHPEDAVRSYRKTLSNATVVKEQLHSTFQSPEEAFTLWTVEELTQSLE